MQIAKEVGLNRLMRYAIYAAWQTIFDLLPFSPLRIIWLKLAGARVGRNTVIDKIDFINLDRTGFSGLNIGARCFLGRSTQLDLAGKLTLKDWVTISPRVTILTHTTVGFKGHPLFRRYPAQVGQTLIDTGCFIGAGAIILGGVRIGKKTVVGAGAVVTRSLPQNSLAVGVPARVKKHL